MSLLQKSRRDAALQLLGEGWSPQEVAVHLDVPSSTLYRWRAEARPATPPSQDVLYDALPGVIRRLLSLALGGNLRAIRDFLALLRSQPDPAPITVAVWHAYRAYELGIFEAELAATSPDLVTEIIAFHRRATRRLDLVLAGKMPFPECDFSHPAPGLNWVTLGRAASQDSPPDDPDPPSARFRPDETPEMGIAQETPEWS